MLTGIDVSDYQDTPDFEKVHAAGHLFVITKATQGDSFLAKTFSRNWHAIKAAGMIRGAYHWAEPHNHPATVEADWFVKMVERQGYGAGDLPLMLDLEDEATPKQWGQNFGPRVANWVGDFVTRVEHLTGRKPIIYTGAYYYSGPTFGCKLWLPSYYDNQRAPWDKVSPKLPPAWKDYTIWQHSDKGTVPGVTSRVDLNVFNGTLVDLHKLAAIPVPLKMTLADRLKKAGLGAKSVATILKKLGRN